MARPLGSQNKDKPFRDALRMELNAAGDDHKTLRAIALNLIAQSLMPEPSALPAIREIADRVDGKVAQGIIGGEQDDPAVVLSWLAKS